MIALPLVAPVSRTAAQRAARAETLRVVLGPPSGWPEHARDELEERLAIVEADGVADAGRVAEDAVRAWLLRTLTSSPPPAVAGSGWARPAPEIGGSPGTPGGNGLAGGVGLSVRHLFTRLETPALGGGADSGHPRT